MMRAAWMVVALLGLSACRIGNVDTTKDVYDDSDAPEYQIYVVNGTTTQIPWKDVPLGRQWLSQGSPDGSGYTVHVPIVRVEVWANDKDGKPVEPGKGDVWDGRKEEIGLNPKHMRTGILGRRR